MLVVQNLAKENYLLKFKMAAMPIYGKKRSNDFFSRTTVPIRLIFCMKLYMIYIYEVFYENCIATLVAMATVHEKFQMTFPIKVLSKFHI